VDEQTLSSVVGSQDGASPFLTLDEVAHLARNSRRTLERLIAAGDGPATVRIGRRVFAVRTSCDRWLTTLVEAAA
jgi:predicted DNA-binding transcriptional regulator AlpA